MVWRVNNQFRQAHEQAEASVRAYNDAIARQEDELLVLQSYIEDPRHRTYTYDGNGAAVETVTVSWQGETRTLTEWRAVVYGREAQLQKVKTDRDAVVQNALKGAEYRLWQHRGEVLRDIEASIPEPTGVDPLTIEYQRLNAARDALAALGDYEEARQYNWRLQALLPDLFTLPTDMAEAVDVELKLRHAELVLDDEAASRAGLEPVLADLRTVDTAQELTRRFTMARFHADAMRREIGSLAVQRHLTRAVEYLDQNLRRRDELSALVSAPPLEELLPLAFSQDLYTALAAVRGTTVRTVEGAEAFDRWYAGIVHGIDRFERRVRMEPLPETMGLLITDQFASTRLHLAKIQWVAGRYLQTYADAGAIQRDYPDTATATAIGDRGGWLYRLRPEAFDAAMRIRSADELKSISFAGLGAAIREAFAHINENSAWVRHGVPVLGCAAGAAVGWKLGSAAGATAGSVEPGAGTALGAAAGGVGGATLGCGLGAAVGALADWTAAAITAPEVAQAWLSGYSEQNWGISLARLELAALDLAGTYGLGRTALQPLLGAVNGAWRGATAMGRTMGELLSQPMATLGSLSEKVSLSGVGIATGRILTQAGLTGLFALSIYPDLWAASPQDQAEKPSGDFTPVDWAISIGIVAFATWSFIHMFHMDLLTGQKGWLRAHVGTVGSHRMDRLDKLIKRLKLDPAGSIIGNAVTYGVWTYIQHMRGKANPYELAGAVAASAGFVWWATLAKVVTEGFYKRSVIVEARGPIAKWLRKHPPFGVKSLTVNMKRVRFPDFWVYSAINLAGAWPYMHFMGGATLNPDMEEWGVRVAWQMVVPKTLREALLNVPLGISTVPARLVSYGANIVENLVMDKLFPTFTGQGRWHEPFRGVASGESTWDEWQLFFREKMERITVDLEWELMPKDMRDLQKAYALGTFPLDVWQKLTHELFERSQPDRFRLLSLEEKRVVVGVLSSIAHVPEEALLTNHSAWGESIDNALTLRNETVRYLRPLMEQYFDLAPSTFYAMSIEDLTSRINAVSFEAPILSAVK